jgi:hypothetical protein
LFSRDSREAVEEEQLLTAGQPRIIRVRSSRGETKKGAENREQPNLKILIHLASCISKKRGKNTRYEGVKLVHKLLSARVNGITVACIEEVPN